MGSERRGAGGASRVYAAVVRDGGGSTTARSPAPPAHGGPRQEHEDGGRGISEVHRAVVLAGAQSGVRLSECWHLPLGSLHTTFLD
jgi:hypothetical protein